MYALSLTISSPSRISCSSRFSGPNRRIIFESLTLAPMCVAYVGVQRAYSYSATLAYYPEYSTLPTKNALQLLQMVEEGNVDVAILLVWCSGETYRDNFISLLKSNPYVVGEIYLMDLHRLLALPIVSQEDLKTVILDHYSLLHCDHVLTKMDLANIIEFYDVAATALSVAKLQLPTTGVIANGAAVNLYGHHTLSLRINHRIFWRCVNNKKFSSILAKPSYHPLPPFVPLITISWPLISRPRPQWIWREKLLSFFRSRIELSLLYACWLIMSWAIRQCCVYDYPMMICAPIVIESLVLIKKSVQFLKVLGTYPDGSPWISL